MGVLESRHAVLRGVLGEEGGQSTVDWSGQRVRDYSASRSTVCSLHLIP